MNDDRPDQFTMIGLHKLASECGDGLVPELYALVSSRTRMLKDNPDVTAFPAWQARLPARRAFGPAPEARDNILPFPSGETAVARNKGRA